VCGHKKDIVITPRLAERAGRVAIYGWHRAEGVPIQPLSTVHEARYADYSHGVRLVSDTVFIGAARRPVFDVLEDPYLCRLLSDEGVNSYARRALGAPDGRLAPLAPATPRIPLSASVDATAAPSRAVAGGPDEPAALRRRSG